MAVMHFDYAPADRQSEAVAPEVVALTELTPRHLSLVADVVELDTEIKPISDRLELAEDVIIWPWMRACEFAAPNDDYDERYPDRTGLRACATSSLGLIYDSVDIPAH